MSFKVNKIAAAVAMSLGTSVVGMNAVLADEVFFPNVGMSATVTTILSVINDNDYPPTVLDQSLHYRYYYKPALNADGSPNWGGVCQEANYKQPTSSNDIVTFDVSGHFGDAKGVLFEPVTSSRYNKSFAIFKGQPATRAFAIIDNNDRYLAGQAVNGEAYIIEFTTGSVWGYHAYNAAEILGTDDLHNVQVGNPYDFSDRVETNGEVLVETLPSTPASLADDTPPYNRDPDEFLVPIAIMPWSGNIQTALFVTPVSRTPNYRPLPAISDPSPASHDGKGWFQLDPTITTSVGLVVNDPSNVAQDVMYDRDENPFSGAVMVGVTCIARVNIPNMISSATQQFVRDSGGWSNVKIEGGTGVLPTDRTWTDQAVVLKLEYNDKAPADLDGKPTGAAGWNNGFWLRQGIRESIPRTCVVSPAGDCGYDDIEPLRNPVRYLPVFDVPGGQILNSPYPLINIPQSTGPAKDGWSNGSDPHPIAFPPVYGASSEPYIGIASTWQ